MGDKEGGLRKSQKEQALLIGTATTDRTNRYQAQEELEELAALTTTAGAQVFEKILQVRKKIDPAFYIGQGKVKELKMLGEQFSLDLFIFNCELSPTQKRNLESELEAKVIDHSELIMDIFAQHARTEEARLQVELAQLKYRLPRLTGKGILLSQLGAGIGTRGPGEKKLETDRRRIMAKIDRLEEKLRDIERSKVVQRKRRKEFFKVALVGYTNVGKSMLMNALTRANVYVDNGLFATLDTTTRVLCSYPIRILLSDTVGFIKRLPPHLIASFKATLSVVNEADLLLHVVDISHPNYEEQVKTVAKILEEIGAEENPIIMVFNKIDLLLDNHLLTRLEEKYPDSVFISAKTGEGLSFLRQRLELMEKHPITCV